MSQSIPNTDELLRRPMTAEERVAYTFALDSLRTWAAQLEAGASKLSHDPRDGPTLSPADFARRQAKFTGDLAHAMQLGFVS